MKQIPKFGRAKVFVSIFATAIFVASSSIQPQSDLSNRKDSPIGLVVYCPVVSNGETPFDFERTLGLWYKRYKQQKIQEGGGAILLVSAPYIPKTSPEIERLKKSLGAEIIFTGHHSVLPKKETETKPSDKKSKNKKGSKKKKQTPPTESQTDPTQPEKLTPVKVETPKPKEETQEEKPKQTVKAKPSSKRKGKKKAPKISAKKQPVIPPGILSVQEEAGLNFVFYSPSLESLAVDEKNPAAWIPDFKSQYSKTAESQVVHFLLAQDPSDKPKEDLNPITDGLATFKKELSDSLPSVTLLSGPRALRFFNGEYSFGCGATPDSLKISILELFFRNGRLIRISEETQTLNSKESNKSWILE